MPSKNFWWYSGSFLPLLWTQAYWQSLTVSSGSNCWFANGVCEWIKLLLLIPVNWTADNSDNENWNYPNSTVSNQVHILLCPINLSFPLPLVDGGLNGRLKHLSTLIKVGFDAILVWSLTSMPPDRPSQALFTNIHHFCWPCSCILSCVWSCVLFLSCVSRPCFCGCLKNHTHTHELQGSTHSNLASVSTIFLKEIIYVHHT